ncbi:MAG: hypothetical protein R3C03_15675 [Pirellulaceae bacterium]
MPNSVANQKATETKRDFSDSTTEYENSQKVVTEIDRTPGNKTPFCFSGGKQQGRGSRMKNGALVADISTKIQQIVSNAVGFEETRGDSIYIDFPTFPELEVPAEVAAPMPWGQINEIIRNVSLGLAAVVAGLLGFLALRKMKPTPLIDPAATPSVEGNSSVSQIGELLKNNPEAFAQIVAAWARSGEESGSQDSKAA